MEKGETVVRNNKRMGDSIGLPLRKKKGLFGKVGGYDISRNTKGEIIPENQKLKEPIALIIKDNFDIEIRENVAEGIIKIERRLAQDKVETVRIVNPKSKLLSFPYGNGMVRGWIIDEKEAVALPTNVTHDSWELKRIMDALVMNYKSMDDNSKNKWYFYAIVGILGLFLISAIFGVNIWDVFGVASEPAKTIIVTSDVNAIQPLIGMIRPW